jgi:hypothetical protein
MEIAGAVPAAEIEWVGEKEAAERYGSFTSGQVFVYDKSGEIVFSGGITPGRGVDQPQYAVRFFKKLFSGERTESTWPVYGCPLQGREQ